MALDSGITRSLAVLRVVIGCAAVLLGCSVLIGGWAHGVNALKSVLPGLSTMKPNTAAGIAALGAGVALTTDGPSCRVFGKVAAAIALGLGLITLAEYAFDWNAGIDQLLFEDAATLSAAFPGRPALATSLMMALLGAGLLSVHTPALHRVKTVAALSAALMAWTALNAYVFGAQALRELPLFGSVALHTSAAILLLAVAVLAAEPVSWPIGMVLAKGTGGIVCRWLLPPAILAPPFLGWLLSRESVLDVFPSQFALALYSAASSLGSVWLIMLLAHRITLIDAERTAATELSRHDPLTGLANRRAFDSFLLETFNLAKRHDHALSLLLLDIDRFKSYNDAYGHPAGDELLKSVGMLLSSVARETDLVARVGGEEFAIILPETDLAGAQVLAERARADVERSLLFRRRVTISVGIAAVTGETASTSTLVQNCDAALYRAKGAGRNQASR
jgi:diguanylate cyclase (GGDEF)-like protein